MRVKVKIIAVFTFTVLAFGCAHDTDEVVKVSDVGKPMGSLSAEDVKVLTGLTLTDTVNVEVYELKGVKVSGDLDTRDFGQLTKLVEKQCESGEKLFLLLRTPRGEKVVATTWNDDRTKGHRFTFDRSEGGWKLTITRESFSSGGQR